MLSKYIQYFLDDNDLQINERFTITDSDGNPQYINRKFWINKQNGGKLVCDDKNIPASEVMLSLLRNKMFIKKLPYKPEHLQTYWCLSMDGSVKCKVFCDAILEDLLLRKFNKCYRSREEAEKHREADYKWLESEVQENCQ